jgi:eukaryotic-like serine/threonine-protein kinase
MGRTGRVLGGRYELGEILGRGGMSVVHRGFDRRTGREVAVKVFQRGVDLVHEDVRYRREILLLSGLNDPGLVTVFDADLGEADEGEADEPDATPYLVTELVDGQTLSQRIRQSTLTEAEAARLGAALCRTLGYVHDNGIVHRDVKPANILLWSGAQDPVAMPKLVDFGIAVVDDETRLTSHDVTVGTANYLSPEQVRGEPVTSASDIYSLGLVLIEALTGEPAYTGTGIEVAMARLNRAPAIPETVSPGLRATLSAMTAQRPADRPDAQRAAAGLSGLVPAASADALSTAVLPIISHHRPPAHGRKAPAPGNRRRRTIAAAGVLVAATIAALVTIAATGSPSPLKPPSHSQPPQQAAPPSERLSTANPASTLRSNAPGQVAPDSPGAPTPASTRPAPPLATAPVTAATTAAPPRSTAPATPTPAQSSSAAAPSPSTTPPTPPPTTSPPTTPPPTTSAALPTAAHDQLRIAAM